jgi:hypothetical protein
MVYVIFVYELEVQCSGKCKDSNSVVLVRKNWVFDSGGAPAAISCLVAALSPPDWSLDLDLGARVLDLWVDTVCWSLAWSKECLRGCYNCSVVLFCIVVWRRGNLWGVALLLLEWAAQIDFSFVSAKHHLEPWRLSFPGLGNKGALIHLIVDFFGRLAKDANPAIPADGHVSKGSFHNTGKLISSHSPGYLAWFSYLWIGNRSVAALGLVKMNIARFIMDQSSQLVTKH